MKQSKQVRQRDSSDRISQRDIDIFRSLLDEYVANPDNVDAHIYSSANIQQCDEARDHLDAIFASEITSADSFELESLRAFALAVNTSCPFPRTCETYGYEPVMQAVEKIDRFLMNDPSPPGKSQPRKPSVS